MGEKLYWYTHSESDCAWVSRLPPEEVESGDDGCVLYAGPAILCTREEIIDLVPAAEGFTIQTENND